MKELFLLSLYYCLLIIIFSCVVFIGDKIGGNTSVQRSDLLRAFTDNFTHTVIAVISWAMVVISTKGTALLECALCGFFGSVIDIDHFLMANSFRLKNALNLTRRPPFHCTSIVVTAVIIFIVFSTLIRLAWWRKVGWIIFVAATTHHLRDALRRGLWIWPYGSTQPLKPWLYFTVSFILPFICRCLINWTSWKVENGEVENISVYNV